MAEVAKHTPNLNDGGFAFPFQFGMGHSEGMTLRDWFSGQALVGALANSEGIHSGAEPSGSILSGDRRAEYALWLATQSYAIADAMIAARAKATTT